MTTDKKLIAAMLGVLEDYRALIQSEFEVRDGVIGGGMESHYKKLCRLILRARREVRR